MGYDKLFALSLEAKRLETMRHLLAWDQETYMPKAGAGPRAAQNGLIAKLIHQHRTGKGFQRALEKLIDLKSGKIVQKGLSRSQQAALREWRRDFLTATKLPTKFVESFAKLCSESMEAWKVAKENNHFATFAPFLEKIIAASKKKADLLGYKDSPYDALIDEFEPDMTVRHLSLLFDKLRGPLVKLRKAAPRPNANFLLQRYSPTKQMAFGHELLEAFHVSKERARLDLSAHPFITSLHPDDGRITTRINANDPMENSLAVMHEGGHYLYESQLPAKHFGSPICEAISLGIHESQSRWWETLIGQSLPFWKHYFPRLKKAFPKQLDGISVNTFYCAINRILDTPIRIASDEISYCLHVILRFELERDLITEKLSVSEVPDAWNAKMEELLNITPKNHAQGCLQDIHWSWGAFGYFPTYALGNLYAAQFFQAFAKQNPTWDKQIAKGKFSFMHDWLRENIHQHGRTYTAKQLIKRVTGKPLSVEPYLNYLTKKYHSLAN